MLLNLFESTSLASYQAYFVIAVIVVLFFVIYKEYIRPAVAFLMAMLIFLVFGILTSEEVLAGFSNEKIAIIVLLILITAGLRKNFNIEYYFNKLFRRVKSYTGFLLSMMTKVALLSAVVNNTPVVAVMTPYVFNWGKKNNISPSKLLIPLSFATILGGMITIIGTSTTLVLNGFLSDYNLRLLALGDFVLLGSVVTLIGILFIAFIGHRLLPDRRDLLDSFNKNKREYIVETQLESNSILINQSIKDGGLRSLNGVYLVEIIRNDEVISPVPPAEVIEKDDTLVFAGDIADIAELIKSDQGIVLPDNTTSGQNKVKVVEAVLSSNSSIVGKRVKDSDFRNRYDAAIVAVQRNGEKIRGKIGKIKLSAGDLLLLYAGSNFSNKTDIYRDIYVISELRDIKKPKRKKVYSLLLIIFMALLLLVLGYFSLFSSLLIIFAIMAGLKLITLQDIKRELDMNMVAILVFSLALGKAMTNTGAGEFLSQNILTVLEPYGMHAILAGIMIITAILTSFINNVGAVSIAFPLALSLSQQLGVDGMPLFLGIAFAASAAFLTPVGYQTNLIIYGPGGYNFKDFFKIGLPVTIVYLISSFIGITMLYSDFFS